MDRTTLENDLIDLLDGKLPPERADRVRRALSADPGLRRQVEKMAEDRRGLGRLRQADERRERSDPGGVRDAVRSAVEMAEREGLVGRPSPMGARARGNRGGGRHIVAAVALVAMLGVVVGVSVLLGFKGKELADSVAGGGPRAHMKSEAKDFSFEASGAPRASGQAGSQGLPSAAGGENSTSMALAEDQGRRVSESLAEDRERLESWSAEAMARVGGDPSSAWRAFPSAEQTETSLARARSGEMSLEDAAVLAFTHRLRVVIPDVASGASTEKIRDSLFGRPALHESASAATAPGFTGLGRDESSPAAGRSWSLDVRASLDPERAAVRGALAEIIERLAASSATRPRFEVVDEDPAAALPAVSIDDVLWWTRPASDWTRGVSLRVDVVAK